MGPDFDITIVLIQVGILLLSLAFHESAHAWSANLLGDPTARYLGRVSLNPIRHIDLIGTVLFPLMGLLLGGMIFGWAKPVPVNPRNLKNPRKDHALIAAAGPASNLLLAACSLVALKMLVSPSEPGLAGLLSLTVYFSLLLNVILAVFNLFPIPPLDGGWILSGFLPEAAARLFEGIRPYGFALLVVFLYSGVFSNVLRPILAFVQQLAL
jgi:Zn-dependent protease